MISEAQREYEEGVALKTRIAELEARSGSASQQVVQELHDEVARLKYQITKEQNAHTSTRIELMQRTIQSSDLQMSLHEESCKVSNAMSEREGLLQQMALLESDLTQWKAKYSQAEETLQAKSSTLTDFERIAADADYHRRISEERSQQVTDLESALEEEKLEIARMSRELAKESTARNELQEAYAILHQEFQETMQQRDHLTFELTMERDRYSKLLRESNQTRQDLATIESDLEEAQANLEASQADNDRHRTSASEHEKQSFASITELSQQLNETRERLSSNQQDLSKKDAALNKITKMWQDLRKDVEDNGATFAAARDGDAATITHLRQDLRSAEDQLSVVNRVLEESQREISELQSSAQRAAQRDSAVIDGLTGRLELYRNHPFRAFFMTLAEAFGRQPMAFLEGLRVARFNKVVRSASSGVEPVDK